MLKSTTIPHLDIHRFIQIKKNRPTEYLTVPVILAVMIGFLLNQIEQSNLLYATTISMIYALTCGLLVVYPISYQLSKSGRRLNWNLAFATVVLTLLSSVLAEWLVITIIYNSEFLFSEAFRMFYVNLMLSTICIYIYSLKTKSELKPVKEFVSFRTSDGIQMQRTADIHFLYAKNKYVFINLGERELLADKTLKALEVELPANFLRVSRSKIINTQHLEKVKKDKKGRIVFYLTQQPNGLKAGVTYQRKLRHLITA